MKVSDERGLAPPLFSNDPDDWESWSFATEEPGRPKWGDWGGTLERPRVRDFRLAVDIGSDDPTDVAREVYESIGPWWRLARTWIELLSTQDLQGVDRFHWSNGSLALWSPAQTRLRMHQDGSRLRQSPRLSLDFDAVPGQTKLVFEKKTKRYQSGGRRRRRRNRGLPWWFILALVVLVILIVVVGTN